MLNKSFFLFLVFLVSLLSYGQGAVQNISAAEFKAEISSNPGIILDVRTPDETAQGFIPGASFINFYDESFAQKVKLMQKDKPIYVYCRSGGRSSKAAEILKQNGFDEIYNLNGGIGAWINAGYSLDKRKSTTSSPTSSLSVEEFNELLETNSIVLVDYHTQWCSPCKKMNPIIDELKSNYRGKAEVLKINVDRNKEIAKNEKVIGVPVFAIYKNGKEVWRKSGVISKEDLEKTLNSFI